LVLSAKIRGKRVWYKVHNLLPISRIFSATSGIQDLGPEKTADSVADLGPDLKIVGVSDFLF
jgi:hypothetical protein